MRFRAADRETAGEIHRGLGVIIRVNRDGLAFIEDSVSGQRYVFTFDKVHGFAGESAKDTGIQLGARVVFTASANRVRCVRILGRSFIGPKHEEISDDSRRLVGPQHTTI
jgi:hypothetical protein